MGKLLKSSWNFAAAGGALRMCRSCKFPFWATVSQNLMAADESSCSLNHSISKGLSRIKGLGRAMDPTEVLWMGRVCTCQSIFSQGLP